MEKSHSIQTNNAHSSLWMKCFAESEICRNSPKTKTRNNSHAPPTSVPSRTGAVSTRTGTFSLKNSQNHNNDGAQVENPMSASSRHIPDDSYAQFFLKNLRNLREEDTLIDISFSQKDADEREHVIKGHRVVLAALSPVLRQIFTKRQASMSADHITPEALRCLVDFVYKSEAQLNAESIVELSQTAQLLSIRQIQMMTSKIMQKLGISRDEKTGEIMTTKEYSLAYHYAYRSQTIPGLLTGLEAVRERGLFCDVTLIAQDEKHEIRLPCHRVVLASASQVFRAIMTSVQTHDILLRRVEPSALRALIDYLYTGKLSITMDNMVPLLKAGHRFGCPFVAKAAGAVLDEICTLSWNSDKNKTGEATNSGTGNNQISTISFTSYNFDGAATTFGEIKPNQVITPDNWLDVYRLSSIYALHPLRECVKRYISGHFTTLVNSKSFKQARLQDVLFFANSESVRSALQNSEEINNDESEAELRIFRALLNWIMDEPEERAQNFTKIMSAVKFHVIQGNDLKRHVMSERLVIQDELILEKVNLAFQRQQNSHSNNTNGEDTIIAIGGLEIAEETATLETTDNMYWLNLEQQTWPEYSSLPDKRRCHSVAVLKNKLYVVGGESHVGQMLETGYRYDIAKNDWMVLPNLNEKRMYAELVVWAGSVFIIGGETLSKDAKHNQPLTGNSMRSLHSRNLNTVALASVEVLDEKRRKWKKIGSSDNGLLPNPTSKHATCGAPGHGIFVSGGEKTPNEFALIRMDEVDDQQPHSGSFTSQVRSSARYLPLGKHKVTHQGHQLHWINKKLYLVDSSHQPSQVCEYFDVSNKQWITLTSFTPVPRSFTSSAALGDVIYLLGSSEEHNSLTQSLQAFDTDSQDWLQMSGLPPSCKDFRLCVIRIPYLDNK